MLPDHIKNWYVNFTSPITGFFTRYHVHPNSLTITGFLITCVAAYVIAEANLRLGGLLILLGGTFDVFDGGVARSSGLSSKFGSFFDSSLDRYAEILLFLSFMMYFLERNNHLISFVILLALGGSLMVSYTRARAEALGIECKLGFFQRPERIIFIGVGALLSEGALAVVLWILAVLSNMTALQRMVHVYQVTRERKEGK